MELIDKDVLYRQIAEKEELARNRVIDTPTNSPAYMRYVAQLNERTLFKYMIYDAPAVETELEPEEIRELSQAKKEGRLVVLPCKVGDTVYWIHNGIITECRVHRIQINRTGLFICLKSKVVHGDFRADICMGKTVFLNHEDAEAALKGGEEND